MNLNALKWESLGHIADGGTVLSLTVHDGKLWAGTLAGLFVRDDAGWQPVVQQIPFLQVHSLLSANSDLLAAGVPRGVIRSTTAGQVWQRSMLDMTEHHLTCLAASPNHARDGVVLAGTAGDGVLRSTDGGRSWNLANFGLLDFEIFAIACAPSWPRREFAVAATASGVYQSPNGGRAWRETNFPKNIVPQLFLFDDDMVLAGTENAGIFFSKDNGMNWDSLPNFPTDLSITALFLGADGAINAGTADGKLFRISANDLQSSTVVKICDEMILCIAEYAGMLLVGTNNSGLWCSDNGGVAWVQDQSLHAHRFNQLNYSGEQLIAMGPMSGVFVSENAGKTWQPKTHQKQKRQKPFKVLGIESPSSSTKPTLLRPNTHQQARHQSGIKPQNRQIGIYSANIAPLLGHPQQPLPKAPSSSLPTAPAINTQPAGVPSLNSAPKNHPSPTSNQMAKPFTPPPLTNYTSIKTTLGNPAQPNPNKPSPPSPLTTENLFILKQRRPTIQNPKGTIPHSWSLLFVRNPSGKHQILPSVFTRVCVDLK